jgi:hypothetical protein
MSCTKKKFFRYEIMRCAGFFYDAKPHYVADWYKCLCRLSGVRLDKWMRKSSAMNFGLQSDQTCGGQTNIADWYLSCPTTECWERSDCFTVGVPARVQIPKPDILCQRSWFSQLSLPGNGKITISWPIAQNSQNSLVYKIQIHLIYIVTAQEGKSTAEEVTSVICE